jgi:putative FmdB family regulatory protein
MPFYEYQCKKCDHRLEVLQKISDEPLIYCPECNEASLKKLISAVAFRLKGTGWYETDFKNNDKKKEKSAGESSNGTSSNGSSSNGTSSNDSKSATKSGDSGVKADSGKSASTSSKKSTSTSAST